MSRLRSAALAYARHGWHVFPCRPGAKVPATGHGCKDATADPVQVERWWSEQPEANIGVATGAPSGIYVLDVDGDEGLDALIDLGHGVPSTLTQETPSGGWHFVFAHPHGKLGNTARTLGPCLDTRGDGGYILVAPSVHPHGGRYRWVAKARPAQVPGWLLRLLRDAPPERSPRRKVERREARGYVEAAVERERQAVASAPEGTRNDTLNGAAFKLGTLVGAGVLDAELVHEALLAAAQACGLGEREARRTITSGLSAGTQHPREGVPAA